MNYFVLLNYIIIGPEGHCDETEAIRPAVAMTDISTGLMAYGAIVTALFERTKSNLGQHLNTSLMETHLTCLVPNASAYLTSNIETMNRYGSGNSSLVPYQVFYCNDKKGIAIGIGSDKQFELLCEVLDMKYLLENENQIKYKTNANRVKNRNVLIPLLCDKIKTKSRSEWEYLFQRKEEINREIFPYGPLRKISEAFECEQAKAREMIFSVNNHKTIRKKLNLVGHAVKYSRTPSTTPSETLPPPVLGQHTIEILTNICNYNEHQIKQFETNKIIYCNHY